MGVALRNLLLAGIGPASPLGICWHITQPPILEIEFEMDVHGIATDLASRAAQFQA